MLIEAYNIIDTQPEDFVEVGCDYIVQIKSWSNEYLEMLNQAGSNGLKILSENVKC